MTPFLKLQKITDITQEYGRYVKIGTETLLTKRYGWIQFHQTSFTNGIKP